MRPFRFSCIIALILSAISAQADVSIVGEPVVNPSNGHVYYLLSNDTWTNSEAFAATIGGHLATINDAAENAWVYDTFSAFAGVDRSLWIGMNDVVREGAFVWISGETAGYTNWSAGQPNNGITSYRGPEAYAHFWSPRFCAAYGFPPGTWNDYVNEPAVDGWSPLHGVVEIDPVIRVSVDIKPGNAQNTITLRSGGVTSVAILGSRSFDVTSVDPTSVTLASAAARLTGKGTPVASLGDINNDGYTDLVVQVDSQAMQLSDTASFATLEGKTRDGKTIRGSDFVRVVP